MCAAHFHFRGFPSLAVPVLILHGVTTISADAVLLGHLKRGRANSVDLARTRGNKRRDFFLSFLFIDRANSSAIMGDTPICEALSE